MRRLYSISRSKTAAEVGIARFLGLHAKLPVPRVLHHGQDAKLGSFVIAEYIQSPRSLCTLLETPGRLPEDPPVLNPQLPDDKLLELLEKPARCLLQLFRPEFPRIGSILETESSFFEVKKPPITINMNDMVQTANIPRAVVLPSEDKTYGTAGEWYTALSELHIAQIIFQHNDLILSEDDCRNKYVARQIFRRLARQGRLSTFGFAEDNWSVQSLAQPSELSAPDPSGPFHIWGDDFRPANILLDEKDDVAAVIDWEFAYAAPTQFSLDPPWFLLLEFPEMWDDYFEDYERVYNSRVETWISAMKRAEKAEEAIGGGGSQLPFPLSRYMRESWSTGRFWLNYAARKSWAFDTIFWTFLDERFFGKRDPAVTEPDLWKTRIGLLTGQEREAMEPFVKWKMDDCKERVLVDWDPVRAKERMSELLFD